MSRVCPSCGAKLSTEKATSQIRCEGCGKTFRSAAFPPPIPSVSDSKPTPPPPVPPPPAPKAEAPQPASAPPGFVTDDAETSMTRKRTSRRSIPHWVVWAGLGLVIAGGIGAAAYIAVRQNPQPVAEGEGGSEGQEGPAGQATDTASSDSESGPQGAAKQASENASPGIANPESSRGSHPSAGSSADPAVAPPEPQAAEDAVAAVLSAAVTLEIVMADNTSRQASAVLIDDRGWFLTPLHVLDDAKQVSVRFPEKGGLLLRSTGIVEADRRSDTALIAVGAGALAALNADGSIRPVSVLAAPDVEAGATWILAAPAKQPGKIVPCEVQQALPAASLPPRAKAVLQQRTQTDVGESGPRHWLQLNLPAETLVDGTPLFTDNGELAAIVYQLNTHATATYARAGLPVRNLLSTATGKLTPFGQEPAVSELAGDADDPLRQFAVSASENNTTEFEDLELDTLSQESLQGLLAVGREFHWKPEDHVQYRRCQWVGRQLTEVGQQDEAATQEARLHDAAQKLLDELATIAWPSRDTIQETNKLAVEGMKSSEVGFFGYGKVLAVVPGEGETRDLIFMELIGTDKAIVVPARQESEQFSSDSRWLVLGYRNGQRIQLNLEIGGELNEYPAEGIESDYLISEEPVEK